jgi:hypothetical protein
MSKIDGIHKQHMNRRHALAVGLAGATFAICIINALGNVAVVFKVGPTPVFSLVAMALAAGAFIVSWKQRSLLVAGLLSLSGIIFMIPALNAMGYSFAAIVFPGPILGIIFGIVIFGLGVANAIIAAKTVITVPK